MYAYNTSVVAVVLAYETWWRVLDGVESCAGCRATACAAADTRVASN